MKFNFFSKIYFQQKLETIVSFGRSYRCTLEEENSCKTVTTVADELIRASVRCRGWNAASLDPNYLGPLLVAFNGHLLLFSVYDPNIFVTTR